MLTLLAWFLGGDVGVKAARSTLKVCASKLKVSVVHCCTELVTLGIGSFGRNSVPNRWLLLHEAGGIHFVFNCPIGQDIKSPSNLLLHALVRDFIKFHVIQSVLFSEHFFSSNLLCIVPDLVSLLLVLLADVLLVQSAFVLYVHVDGVVHQSVILYGLWQLFNLVLAMDECFLGSSLDELFFFVFVEILGINQVVVMGFPESLCCFESLYVNVCFLFFVVVL